MALATYSDLKSAVADWLVRTDLGLKIPDFIALAEARINRELRTREMISTATASVSTQAITIPSDFIEVYRFVLDTESDVPLEYRPAEDSERRTAGVTSGEPQWFSVVGTQFRLYPTPDGEYTYTLDYYGKVPALSDSASTNWLLTKAPDLYLFGALKEGAGYLLDTATEQAWDAKFQMVKRSLHLAEARSKRTSGPRRSRILV